MKKILIAGCGYVGTELGLQLQSCELQVFGLRRNAESLPPGISGVSADLTSGVGLSKLPEGIDAVCYAVAAAAHDESAYRDAYVTGVKNLLHFLESRGDPLKRVIYVSSTGVYGQNSGEWVDEGSPTEPPDFSGRVLLEGEASVRELSKTASIVRFGGIYGPGRIRLLRQVIERKVQIDTSTVAYTNRIHRDDCAGMLRHLLFLEAPPALCIGVDREPCDRNDVYLWIAEKLKIKLERKSNPDASGVSGKRCRSSLIGSTGYSFLFPDFRSGYEALLQSEAEALQ